MKTFSTYTCDHGHDCYTNTTTMTTNSSPTPTPTEDPTTIISRQEEQYVE